MKILIEPASEKRVYAKLLRVGSLAVDPNGRLVFAGKTHLFYPLTGDAVDMGSTLIQNLLYTQLPPGSKVTLEE